MNVNGFKIAKRYADKQPMEYRKKMSDDVTIAVTHIYGSYGWQLTYLKRGTKRVINGPWYYTDLATALTASTNYSERNQHAS